MLNSCAKSYLFFQFLFDILLLHFFFTCHFKPIHVLVYVNVLQYYTTNAVILVQY